MKPIRVSSCSRAVAEITKPQLIPKFRYLIESAPALIVHGHIERQERSVNVIAERFERLPIASMAEKRVHNFG